MKLKTLFVLALLMVQCNLSHGQFFGKKFSCGIQLGIGKAGFWSEDWNSYGVRNHIVHSAGLYVSKYLNDKFEPYAGIAYEEKGYVFDKYSDNSAEFVTGHLSLRYYPFKALGFHAILGAYSGFLVKSEEDFNKFDWGARVGLGYKFMVYKLYGVELQGVNAIGFKHDGHTTDGRHLSYLVKIGIFRFID